jgi:hypothetical protein
MVADLDYSSEEKKLHEIFIKVCFHYHINKHI